VRSRRLHRRFTREWSNSARGTSARSDGAAAVPREVSEDTDGPLDACIPRVPAVDTDEAAKSTRRREHRPRCDADTRGARLGGELYRVDRRRQLAPQEKAALRA